MKNKTKKIFVSIALGVYILSNFFQYIFYRGNNVYAAGPQEDRIDYTNIVAIIVNDKIYDSIKNDVERYAKTYIQGAGNNKYTSISNSKALVFPINVDNFSTKNITQLLENIYFDGIQGETSRLIGLILIGDIPLPVVNQNGYIYPTIYPYVDFEEQKFIWDENSKYFVYNNNPNGQAEIWHGMINFGDNINDYKNYFDKLYEYWESPSDYIGKAIWYDDFIGNKKYFNDDGLNFYLNNFIFAEDLGYHRYNDLMVKVMQGQRNDEIQEIMEELNAAYEGLGASGIDLGDLSSLSDDNMNTPTMQIKAMIDNGYITNYSSLFGPKYLKTIVNNVETANRWKESRTGSDGTTTYLNALDTHYLKTEITDETLLRTNGGVEPFLIMINNALEEAVDKKVDQEKYRLDEVLPLTYLKYSGERRFGNNCVWDIYDAYENYFFGQKASNLQSLEEASTYRGTYRNYVGIDGLTLQSIQNSENPATDVSGLDLNKMSIGGSYEIFATQVDANRGYNYNNSIKEYEIYSGNKTAKMENWDVTCVSKFLGICFKRRWAISHTYGSGCDLSEDGDQGGCEDPMEYAMRIWGGASPLNLTGGVGATLTWNSGYHYTGATSPVFDIAGSTVIPAFSSGEIESNSYESINKYSNLTLRKFSPETRWPKFKAGNPMKKDPAPYGFGYDYTMDYDVKFTNMVPTFNRNSINGWVNKQPLTASNVNYFQKFYENGTNTQKEGNIIKISKLLPGGSSSCKGAGEIYTYKTIDSRVKNDSVNEEELNGYTYKIFQDDISHVKQFYENIVQILDSISGDVNLFLGSDGGSLQNNLQTIKDNINGINSGFIDMIRFDIDEIRQLTTGEIASKAQERNEVFNPTVAQLLLDKIKESQNEVLGLSGLVEMGPSLFAGFTGLVENEKSNFSVNGWELILFSGWKTQIYQSIQGIINRYSTLRNVVRDAYQIFFSTTNIGEIETAFDPISLNVVAHLSEKLDQLSMELNGSGCETKYRELCNTLTRLIDNYNTFVNEINTERDGINNIKVYEFDDDGNQTNTYNLIPNILTTLLGSRVFLNINNGRLLSDTYSCIEGITGTLNYDMTGYIPGMSYTTSDRPIDSPRYLTFKGLGGDKITFIYPDIYKAEIYSGNTNEGSLTLKSTGDIADAIKEYLRGVVNKYNDYLNEQLESHNSYYYENNEAYDKLMTLDPLASPRVVNTTLRPYRLFNENYLIEVLENNIRNSIYFSGEDFAQNDPIGFIANMIYYQNISWQTKTVGTDIQDNFDKQRKDFDLNEKVSYILDSYLQKGNDKGKYLAPDYRENGYEVAFINSDGNDYISYDVDIPIVNTMLNLSQNYKIPDQPENDTALLQQQLMYECDIPEEGGVLLFDFSGGNFSSPWWDAVKCRFEVIREKPLEFKLTFPFTWDDSSTFWHNFLNISDYEEIGNNFVEQMQLLDTSDINNEILDNIDLSNPGDSAKLQKILSYTIIKAKKTTVSADNPFGEIQISSSTSLGNIDFHIINVGSSKFRLLDGNRIISNNISLSGSYSTGNITFDPYNPKDILFEIDNPLDGTNVLLFYMCLPGTQDLSNCVRNSIKIDIVPGQVENIKINMSKNTVLEGDSVPFTISGTDKYGNEVGDLITQKFDVYSSSGDITLNGTTSGTIKFSNFDKSKFKLNATGRNLDGQQITVFVTGEIAGVHGIKAISRVNVKKGRIDIYSGSTQISIGSNVMTGIAIKLPDENIYSTTDTYSLSQANTGTLPKLELKLVDINGSLLNIDGTVSVKTKNNLLNPGIITHRTITKNISGQVMDIIQNRFRETNSFELSGGVCTIYLLPSFKAGNDILYISMPGTDNIEIPVKIKHATPKIVEITSEHESIGIESSMSANLKIFDNWNNLVDSNTSVALNSSNDKLSLSTSGYIQIQSGNLDFVISSNNKGGLGHIYSFIYDSQIPLNQQKPAVLPITIQEKMLPENNLNVMYLNLFGNDRGNQRGYMSENEKYSENLIKNSEKLITVTTQLINLENIKQFSTIITNSLQIQNLAGNDIYLALNNSGFSFEVNSIGNISVSTNSFNIEKADISEDAIEQYIIAKMNRQDKGKNILFYMPEKVDSMIETNDIRNGAIYINGISVFDVHNHTFDQNLTIHLGNDNIAGYQVRNMYFDNILIGKILIAVDNPGGISISLQSNNANYGISETRVEGSTKNFGLGFYDIVSQLPTKTFGYKSIQDSYDVNLGIGFTNDFKNITNFGGGMPVGEATLPFGSELLINIGDPLLKRIDDNESAKIYDETGNVIKDTEFDLGLGELIYSEPGKEILKVIDMDFNNDNLQDIVVIFKDGTIKILKNYGGTNPFQKLGDLMILADRISDVSVGDVDGNGYQDLIVRTQAGGLRVYKNDLGIFDVDGYPVCININVDKGQISEHPENISGLYQIFLEDMDQDGALDIVTNDSLGFIKIFYGGANLDGHTNYLSTNKYMCDENWYNRANSSSKLVYQFGIKIDNTEHILDQSLIHWKGLNPNEGNEISAEDVGIDSSVIENTDDITLDNIGGFLNNITNFDTTAAANAYKQQERFKKAGFEIIPVYETGIQKDTDVNYVEIGCLTGNDPVKIYKTYEDLNNNPIDGDIVDTTGSLINGDLVRVTVYIQANQNFEGTFIDNISGPWTIPLSQYDNEVFENFWFDPSYIQRGYITSGQIEDMVGNIHRDLDNARYMIDNIKMNRGDKLKFSYGLIYDNNPVMNIDVNTLTGNNFTGLLVSGENLSGYLAHDEYPDITVQPQDGCNDSMFVFFNDGTRYNKPRQYTQKRMDLSIIIDDYNQQSTDNGSSAINNFGNNISQNASNGEAQSIREQIGGFAGLMETLDWKGMLSSQGLDVSNPANIGMEIVNSLTDDTVKKIDKAIGGACNGIDLSELGLGGQKGCGLPVPFNQAFLGVGKYHAFGCFEIPFLSETIGKGMPVIHAPAMRGTYPAVGFFGLPSYGPVESFFGLGAKSTLDSWFRLYLMPTLTLDLGIALCFGHYAAGINFPDPLGSIAGNCVVFSVPLPCGNSSSSSLGANATTMIPYEYTLLNGCNKQNIPCYLGNNESSSPFKLVASSANSQTFYSAMPDGNFAGGLITIERKPQTSTYYHEDNSFDIDQILLKGGATTQNKIEGSTEQGLIQKIIKSWLDKQIKYIMNNLTNFKISVIWPDFEGLIGKNLSVTSIEEAYINADREQGKQKCEKNKGEWIEDADRVKTECKYGDSYCCIDTPASLQFKCENKGMKWDYNTRTCRASDSALSQLDARGQENLASRDQISSRSEYNNPFKALEDAFNETPLINISTQDITVNIPMIASEDITSYISMSQSWINRQMDILEEWQEFFKAFIGFCGGSTNINGIEDLERAVNDLKEQYKEANVQSDGLSGDTEILENLQWKIRALQSLTQKYNLSDLGDYKIYEAQDGGFYVYNKFSDNISSILPQDVYLYFDPTTTNLTMFTSGFDLIIENVSNSVNIGKSKISIKRNSDEISNTGLQIKKSSQSIYYSCSEVFLDGTIDNTLKGFLNVQSNADTLMRTVKQNIETLQQYQQFPTQLYEWIHVVDRYIGETSSLVNSILGTLSMRMETNANRYSQYVDAIITLMTTLETYQLIIDLSADWSENCSTCTNDNYDQFSCKLGMLCNFIDLPIIEIPPMKIPSIYLDFSEIHVESDIKLPNFVFKPIAVPLPELPDLPSPPDIDLSLNMEDSLSLGLDVVKKFKGTANTSFNLGDLGNIPLIPSPPTLPDLPSFIPSVEMELPLLPPAPKIPALPNEITATIKFAKIVGKVLCIIKGKFGLVSEQAIKAKVEQMTQRDYEVAYRDHFDQTLADWNSTISAKMPSALTELFTGFVALMQTSQFKDTKLKGFDLSLQTYINLQYNFDSFYAFVDKVVNDINGVSYKITDFAREGANYVSDLAKEKADRLQACVNNTISVECLGEGAREQVNRYHNLSQRLEHYKKLIENNFEGLNDIITELENKKDRLQDIQTEVNKLNIELQDNISSLNTYTSQLSSVSDETERKMIANRIEFLQRQIANLNEIIEKYNEEIETLQSEIYQLNVEYGDLINTYNNLMTTFNSLDNQLNQLKNQLMDMGKQIMDEINREIEESQENVDFQASITLDEDTKAGAQEMEEKKNLDKQRRWENLQNLYKEVEGPVSYVNFDPEINENNFKLLYNTLSEIDKETSNKNIKDRAQEYISLITMDNHIGANTDAVEHTENGYSNILNEYKKNNSAIATLIANDYDKFLNSVSDNSISLVNSDSLNITLSAQLFNMNEESIQILSKQDNILKKYMDYNMDSIQGYLNALENNSPETLNMDESVYKLNKNYLSNIKNLSEQAYDLVETTDKDTKTQKILLTQSAGGIGGVGGVGNNNTPTSTNNNIKISNYIDGYTLNTKEGAFLLANNDYINKFQSRFLLTDIDNTGGFDMILWDENSVYIKYRGGNPDFSNAKYINTSSFYEYKIESYDQLLSDAEEGYIRIRYGGILIPKYIYVKVADTNREVKNFKYAGENFDTIKVSWLNSHNIGDEVDGYLVKMIHRVDQFNDQENLISQGNNEELFDKKYILVLPKESELTGTKLETEEEVLNNIENLIGTGNKIFGISYYSKSSNTINLTVTDLPRNWQYSEIYTLNLIGNTYTISSSSSNQIVAGPQIIADTQGPNPEVKLYRPSTDTIVSEGTSLQGYVGTKYVLQVDWEDNVAIDELWIANELGNRLATIENLTNKTGHIELSDLYFTGEQNISFYIGGIDIDGNRTVMNVTLLIKTPSIEISRVFKGNQNLNYLNGNIVYNPITPGISSPGTNESFVTIVAQMDQDIDSGYVQFLRNRLDEKRELLTGTIGGRYITSFVTNPGQTDIYGGYFDIGNDIGLYSISGDIVAKINPENGKITILPGFENIVTIKLDYSPGVPIIKVMEGDNTLFWVIYSSRELVEINTNGNGISVYLLDNESFGEFNGGQAVIRNGEVLMYVSPIGQIYTDTTLFGEYGFDNATDSVIYTFRTSPNGPALGSVKIKIKNLLDY